MLVTVAAYRRVLSNEFISDYDDGAYVTENRQVQWGLSAEGVRWAFTTFEQANWHPLTWLSLMLDYSLWGLNPTGFHLTNLLFHVLNTLLLLLVLARMTGAVWRSGFVAALFAVHPLHVESVAWAAERKDVLSTFFWMLTMGAYVLYTERPNLWRYLPVFFLLAIGLLAKPMLVTLPIVLLLLDYWPLGRLRTRTDRGGLSLWKLILEKVPLIVLVLASAAITFIAQREGGAVGTLRQVPWGIRFGNAMISYVMYIWNMIWPRGLAVFYPHLTKILPVGPAVGSAVLLAVLSALAVLSRRRYVVMGWLWYVLTLVPVIGFVQVGAQARADRYTYIPLTGLFIAIAWAVPELLVRRRTAEPQTGRRPKKSAATAPAWNPILVLSAVAVIAALAVGTWIQVGYWKDSFSLWDHALAVTKHNYQAYTNVGVFLKNQGQIDEAIKCLKEAVRISPDYPAAQNNLGNALARQGKLDEAIYHYRKAMRLAPEDADAYNNLGAALARQGKTREAIGYILKALKLKPDYPDAENNLGCIYFMAGEYDKAAEHFWKALRLKPDYAEAHNNLGSVLNAQGKLDEAMSHWTEAAKLKPDYLDVHGNLAVAYYSKGNYAAAWREVNTIRRLGGTPSPGLLQRLQAVAPEPR